MEKTLEIMESWEKIKIEVKDRKDMSNISYAAWIAPLQIDSICGRTIYVKTKVKGVEDYIKRKFFKAFREIIYDLFEVNYKLAFRQLE